MKRLATMALMGALVCGEAAAEDLRLSCARPGDERRIEVVSPGQVGSVCDVRYTRVGSGHVSTPYYANGSADYCTKSAQALADNLVKAGFTCTPIAQGDLAGQPAPAAPQPAEPQPLPQPTLPAPELRSEAEPAAPEPNIVMTAKADTEPAPQPALEPVAASTTNDALEAQMNEILTQPAVEAHAAQRGPAQLTAEVAATPKNAPAPAPVGRLVGAAPDAAPMRAQAVTQASLKAEAPAAQAAAQPAPKPVAAPSARGPEDIILATLRAQAAAWNEGNLEAFMASYWKSDDLTFVAGDAVTKGWNATLKRYRDKYSGGQGLGRLGFERMEVEMVTNDVAVVTGRFNLVKDGATSSGLFTLVMRRINGVWRIVHDHTTASPAE